MKDIDDIRRDNLRLIEEAAGGPAAAAKLVGMSQSKTGRRRGMHKNTARRIEAAVGKPQGWLDKDHSGAHDAEPQENHKESIQQSAMLATYQRADYGTRAVVDALLSSTPPAWLDPLMALAIQGMKQAASQWADSDAKAYADSLQSKSKATAPATERPIERPPEQKILQTRIASSA